MLWTAGGMGVSGPVSDRGRLVAAEGPAAGVDPDVPARRAENARAGYLLSLALGLLTLLEWVVRERLHQQGAKLQGVYAGQPRRKTARPSAELLLGAMKTISVSGVEVKGQIHALLAPLTEVQKRLLEL